MPASDVVVTAAGVFCALGRDRAELAARWRAGESGIRPITVIDEPWFPAAEGGQLEALDRLDVVDKRQRKHLKVMTRPVRIGLAAARQAWRAREALAELPHPERRGAFVGAGLHVDEGGDFVEPLRRSFGDDGAFELRRWAADGIDVLNPLWLIKGLSNNVLAFVSQFHDLQGVNDNLCDGEVAGLLALIEAVHALREDRCDVALAGGYGTYLTLEDQVGLERAGRLGGSRIPGEGAAFFVLERRADARRWALPALATVEGVGSAQRADDAAARARADAGIGRDAIDRVVDDVGPRLGNAHGGHGALMAAVALGFPGERVAVELGAPDDGAAALVLRVSP